MNIWIEYWEKSKEPSKNTHAQIENRPVGCHQTPKKFVKDFVKIGKMQLDMQSQWKNKDIIQ